MKSDKASIGDLNAANAEIDALKTSKANVADLNAANAEITDLKAEKANVDLLNVVKATIENLLVRGGIITDSLSGVEINASKYLTGVTIIGDVIKAGTLAANRIILTGNNGLIYELNANAGNLTASQLTEEQYKQAIDGSVLVASSITTDKLAAGSITTDKLAVNAVKAKNIDVENLFAQDITATGTITGAQLIGAALSGNAIDIQAAADATSVGLKTDVVDQSYCLVLSTSGGTTKSQIILGRGVLKLFGQSQLRLDTDELIVNANSIVDEHYSKTSYTSFSGGVISSGTINVVKYLGWCQVFGEFTLSAAVSNWTEVLTSAQVPAPKHGINAYVPPTTWGTAFVRAPRIQISGNGGLRVRYGAAATYDFSTAYPI